MDPIIYLSGVVKPSIIETGHERWDLGHLLTPDMGNRPERTAGPWAADNGCFTKPEKYSDERYLAWLKATAEPCLRLPAIPDDGSLFNECCLFANAPDVVHWTGGAPKKGIPVGDPVATLARSRPLLPKIRELGYPAAIVASDGIEKLDIPWDELDAIFLGGDDAWKLGPKAAALVAEAKARGKWVHMGRVNSLKRLRHAAAIGCDSADGTFVRWHERENLYRVVRWLDEVNNGELSLGLTLSPPRKRKPKTAAAPLALAA